MTNQKSFNFMLESVAQRAGMRASCAADPQTITALVSTWETLYEHSHYHTT